MFPSINTLLTSLFLFAVTFFKLHSYTENWTHIHFFKHLSSLVNKPVNNSLIYKRLAKFFLITKKNNKLRKLRLSKLSNINSLTEFFYCLLIWCFCIRHSHIKVNLFKKKQSTRRSFWFQVTNLFYNLIYATLRAKETL